MKYKPKTCVICNNRFNPKSGHSSTCSLGCARKLQRSYTEKWRKLHPNQIKEYEKNRRPISRLQRQVRRAKIQEQWGRGNGNGHRNGGIWEKAENFACEALIGVGFAFVKRVDYFPHFPFDIVGRRNGVHVFCVTTRTHLADTFRKKLLANDLGLFLHIIYVKPSLDGFLLKEGEGMDELTVTDLDKVIIKN